MCSDIRSSIYKSTLTVLQLFLSKIQEGRCISKASLEYILLSEEMNLVCFRDCLTALIEDLQDELKSLQRRLTQLPSASDNSCLPTLLEIPAGVLDSITVQKKTPERSSLLSCDASAALRVAENNVNITENLAQASTTAAAPLLCGNPSACVYSSNQMLVSDAKELQAVVSDSACKNSTNDLHMEVSLAEPDCGSSIAHQGFVNNTQCAVNADGISQVLYSSGSSLPNFPLSSNETQILKTKDGSYNNEGVSPRPRLTDTNGSSEFIAESSLPVGLNSSTYSVGYEVPQPDQTILDSPPVGPEILPNNLFNGVPVLESSMTEPQRKFFAGDLSVELPESLPFLCCKICTSVFAHLESFSGHSCKSLEPASEKTDVQNLVKDKNKLEELKKFTCSICGIELRSVRRMTYHLPRCRPGPYCCGVCTAQFQLKPALHQHMKTQHKCTSCHECEECGKKFARRTSLQKHVILQHEDPAAAAGPYRCDACPKKFIRRIYLTNHKLRMHQLAKPFTCEACGAKLLTAASLAVHERCVHGAARLRHPCAHCGKLFSRKEKLVLHVRRHTGERPYVCEVCSRGFVSRSKLQEHSTRQHLPQQARRRHACLLCHKTYANRADLRKHASRVHGDAVQCDEGSGGAASGQPCAADRSLPPTSRGHAPAGTDE